MLQIPDQIAPQGLAYFRPGGRKHFGVQRGEIEQFRALQNLYDPPRIFGANYDRSLSTKDIEGAVTNTLISKVVKNKEAAIAQRSGSQGMSEKAKSLWEPKLQEVNEPDYQPRLNPKINQPTEEQRLKYLEQLRKENEQLVQEKLKSHTSENYRAENQYHTLQPESTKFQQQGSTQSLNQSISKCYQQQASYEDLVHSKEISQYEGQIAMDVVRTFQNNHLFNIDSITSQSLSAVLRAISLSFQDMGYCQGLNYLAGSFLLLMSDENVYWHIYSLLTKYGCLDMYVNPAFTLKYYFALQGFIKQFLPDVNEKLKKFEIVPFYYAAEWFITLFSSILPMKIFLRVIDIYWFEQLKTIFRTSLAIIKIRKDEIMDCKNMEQAMAVLKDSKYFYNYDPDKFIKIATKDFIFSRKDIDKYFELYQQQPK